jgi:hypothetical protein
MLPLSFTLGVAARAFCGFYVADSDQRLFADASSVVLLRSGTTTVLSMQNTYAGPPEDFALVVPVPVILQRENVRTLPKDVFAAVDRMDSPRLVEYWEQDPCPPPRTEHPEAYGGGGLGSLGTKGMGSSGGSAVTVAARFEVGEYDVVVLAANEAQALERWLRRNGYHLPAGAAARFEPYIASGLYFFVAKVDVERVAFVDGRATLSPLRFHYESETFSLPIRLGLVNARDAQDLVVHIFGDTRYEVANHPNVTIPTNLDVSDDVRDRYPEFYAAVFDEAVAGTPDAVLTEYAWDARSCDPCPGPALSESDLSTLGLDVTEPPPVLRWGVGPLTVTGAAEPQPWTTTVTRYSDQLQYCVERSFPTAAPEALAGRVTLSWTSDQGGTATGLPTVSATTLDPALVGCLQQKVRRWVMPAGGGAGSFEVTVGQPDSNREVQPQRRRRPLVLTRLHARYDATSLGEDLVFRAAEPIAGGHEGGPTRAEPAPANRFQGRYAIRHRWEGPVTCDQPQWGRWGGPPSGVAPPPATAQGAAFAPRGQLSLGSVVVPAKDAAQPASPATPPADAPTPPAPAGGGCATAPVPGGWGLAALLAWARRRPR